MESDSLFKTVKKQVKNIQWHTLNDSTAWGFTIETQLNNGNGKIQQRIQRYDPSLEINEQWQLTEQSQEKPSKAMLHEYAEVQRSIRNEDHEVKVNNIEVVHLVTLEFIEHANDYAIFSFKPRLPMFDSDVNRVFDGKLYFNKTNNHIEKLTISAFEAFSPAFSIEVESYDMNIKVSKINAQLHVTQIESKKVGTFFMFSAFNEINTKTLSRFVSL